MSEAVTTPAFAQTPQRRRRDATRQLWLDRLARFPQSGLTTAQFWAAEGVSLPSFYAWRRRLATESSFGGTPPRSDPATTPRLLPVRLSAAAVELVLPSSPL